MPATLWLACTTFYSTQSTDTSQDFITFLQSHFIAVGGPKERHTELIKWTQAESWVSQEYSFCPDFRSEKECAVNQGRKNLACPSCLARGLREHEPIILPCVLPRKWPRHSHVASGCLCALLHCPVHQPCPSQHSTVLIPSKTFLSAS